jgi:anti-sigma factor RsiW
LNCKDVILRVSSYIDGELEAPIVQEIELHLKTCRECTILVQQTRLTVRWYYDSDLVDFPADVQARLHEALRRKIREARKGG